MAIAEPRDGGFRPDAQQSTSANHVTTMREGASAVDTLEQRLDDRYGLDVNMMRTVRVIGGSMIGIAVLVIVLNEVFTINQINDSSGPFASVIDSLESTGGAALGLLVIGLLVLGANRIMGFFGGGGF